MNYFSYLRLRNISWSFPFFYPVAKSWSDISSGRTYSFRLCAARALIGALQMEPYIVQPTQKMTQDGTFL